MPVFSFRRKQPGEEALDGPQEKKVRIEDQGTYVCVLLRIFWIEWCGLSALLDLSSPEYRMMLQMLCGLPPPLLAELIVSSINNFHPPMPTSSGLTGRSLFLLFTYSPLYRSTSLFDSCSMD